MAEIKTIKVGNTVYDIRDNGIPATTTSGLCLKSTGTAGVFQWVADSDSHYTTHLYATNSSTATACEATTTNGNVHLNLLDNSTVRNSPLFKGTGKTTVTCNSGNAIFINTPLTITAQSIGSASGWSAGSATTPASFSTTASGSYERLILTAGTKGTAPSLTVTTKTASWVS